MAFVWHSFLWRAGEDKVRAEWDGATEGSLFLVYIKQGKLDFQILKWLWLPLQHLLFAVFKILSLVIIFLGTVYFVQASNESSAAWTPSIFEFRVNKPRPHVRSHSLIGLQYDSSFKLQQTNIWDCSFKITKYDLCPWSLTFTRELIKNGKCLNVAV